MPGLPDLTVCLERPEVFALGAKLLKHRIGRHRGLRCNLVAGSDGLAAFERGRLEDMEASFEQFGAAPRRENHPLKRALTDAGIGYACSDEIPHRARSATTGPGKSPLSNRR